MCVKRGPRAARKPTARSAVSNGTRLHQNVDARSSSARRFRDIVDAFTAEVGGELTESERGLVQQAAGLTMRCEQLQGAIIRGEAVDDDLLVRLSGTAKRLLAAIGSKAAERKPSGGMTLAEYVASKTAATETEDEDEDGAEG